MSMTPTSAVAAGRRPGRPSGAPWWRFPMVWFVWSGPAIVVVAGFATMAIAFHDADVVLAEPGSMAARVGPSATGAAARPGATSPALQARNHAATPVR